MRSGGGVLLNPGDPLSSAWERSYLLNEYKNPELLIKTHVRPVQKSNLENYRPDPEPHAHPFGKRHTKNNLRYVSPCRQELT